MTTNICSSRALIAWVAAVLTTGLLTLAASKPAWAAEPNLAPVQNYAVGSNPISVTAAHLNDDGAVDVLDLVVSNNNTNTVSVLLGNADGTFLARREFEVGAGPRSGTSADFDEDGNADFAVAVGSPFSNIAVLLGNGDGTFQTKRNFPVGSGPSSVASADFDGDGDVDLAVTNFDTHDVSVLLGNGDGTFQAARNYSVLVAGTNPHRIITEDLNADGKMDLATANIGSDLARFPGGVSVLLGNGDGTFQDARKVLDHFFDNSVTAADFNDDGKKDLAATGHGCCGGGAVSVALGNGDGTFQPTQRFVVGSGQTIPTSVASAHLNRDEEMDLVVSNSASDNVSVLTGNGDGTFQPARNFSAGDNPAFVIGADFNTDSFTDLAVPNQNSSNVSVLLNTGPAPQTTITSGPSEGQVVNNTSATFGFTSSELGSAFKCSLDNPSDSAYSPCTSPKKIPDEGLLTEGSHTFYVKATGTAGTDLTPATRTWKVDTTAPAAPVINSPANDSFDTDGNVTLAGTAEEGSTVEVFDGETSEGTTPPVDSSGAWSMTLSTVGEGAHTYTAKATDAANNTSGFSNPTKVTVDITKPTVTATTPLSRAINVTRGTNLTATFSEQMMTSSINVKSFRLFRLNADGTQTQITDVVVSLSTDGLKAKLDPFGTKTTLLARSTKYKGVVTIGTKDLAGNPLAQQKSWTFTTKS
jgi:Bacterial Ig-like domain/FG-GAP-like repeat